MRGKGGSVKGQASFEAARTRYLAWERHVPTFADASTTPHRDGEQHAHNESDHVGGKNVRGPPAPQAQRHLSGAVESDEAKEDEYQAQARVDD